MPPKLVKTFVAIFGIYGARRWEFKKLDGRGGGMGSLHVL